MSSEVVVDTTVGVDVVEDTTTTTATVAVVTAVEDAVVAVAAEVDRNIDSDAAATQQSAVGHIPPQYALWVGNLPDKIRRDELAQVFADFDYVTIFLVRRYKCAFVNFLSEEECDRALKETNEREFKGRNLLVRKRTDADIKQKAQVGEQQPQQQQQHQGRQSQHQQHQYRGNNSNFMGMNPAGVPGFENWYAPPGKKGSGVLGAAAAGVHVYPYGAAPADMNYYTMLNQFNVMTLNNEILGKPGQQPPPPQLIPGFQYAAAPTPGMMRPMQLHPQSLQQNQRGKANQGNQNTMRRTSAATAVAAGTSGPIPNATTSLPPGVATVHSNAMMPQIIIPRGIPGNRSNNAAGNSAQQSQQLQRGGQTHSLQSATGGNVPSMVNNNNNSNLNNNNNGGPRVANPPPQQQQQQQQQQPSTSSTSLSSTSSSTASSTSLSTGLPTSVMSQKPSTHSSKIRYFIIKAPSQEHVDISIKHNIWATQPQTEIELNNAFNTCEHVFLIFSAKYSGEFHGYARMTGISTDRKIDLDSPGVVLPIEDREQFPPLSSNGSNNAIATTTTTPATSTTPSRGAEAESSNVTNTDTKKSESSSSESPMDAIKRRFWARSFPVRWIVVNPLPFHFTDHLHNPWNEYKKVKISKDGTELEPTIGAQLIALFSEDHSARQMPFQMQPQFRPFFRGGAGNHPSVPRDPNLIYAPYPYGVVPAQPFYQQVNPTPDYIYSSQYGYWPAATSGGEIVGPSGEMMIGGQAAPAAYPAASQTVYPGYSATKVATYRAPLYPATPQSTQYYYPYVDPYNVTPSLEKDNKYAFPNSFPGSICRSCQLNLPCQFLPCGHTDVCHVCLTSKNIKNCLTCQSIIQGYMLPLRSPQPGTPEYASGLQQHSPERGQQATTNRRISSNSNTSVAVNNNNNNNTLIADLAAAAATAPAAT